jgi:hypothetical protein
MVMQSSLKIKPDEETAVTDVSAGQDQPAMVDGDTHLSLQESLALVEMQGATVARRLRVDPTPILAMWGVAWLAGFGAFYLASSGGPEIVPTWVAGVVLGLAFSAAMATSVGHDVRRLRGIEGPSRKVRRMYGWAWLVSLAGLYAVNISLVRQGLPSNLGPLVWSGDALLVVGLLYLAGGIIWSDWVQYGLGVWTLVTGAASVSVGVPGNFAVLSLAGGGGFLVAAALAFARSRGTRPAARPRP